MERLSIKKAGRRVSGAEALGTSNARGNIENNPVKAGRRVSGAEALGTSNAKGNIENNPVEKTKVNIPLTKLKSTIEDTHNKAYLSPLD